MEKIKIHKDILNLRYCVSTKATRPTFEGIKISQKNGKQTGIATNGQILSTVTVDLEQEDYELLLKPVKINKKLNELTTFHKVGNCWLSEKADKLEELDLLNDYPEIDGALPSKNREAYQIRFDPYLLLDLIKSLGIEKGKGVLLNFDKINDLSPIEIILPDEESKDSRSVLMPMCKN